MRVEIRQSDNGRFRWFLVDASGESVAQSVRPVGYETHAEARAAVDVVLSKIAMGAVHHLMGNLP